MKMKLLMCLCLSVLLSSCIGFGGDDDETSFNPPPQYTAQTMERDVFESAVQLSGPQDVVKAGKIYIVGELMIVNDVNRGFHIYNYSNPQQPLPVAFVNVPGATDIAMRGTTMYINQAVDLVTLEYLWTTNTLTFRNRSRNVFPQKLDPDGMSGNVGENQIIINWVPNN